MTEPAPSRQQGMHSVVVQLPEETVRLLGVTPDQAAACLKKLALIDLFRCGEVSSGYAADVLGMGKWDFIELLGQHGVPYIDLSEDDLPQQVEVARPYWTRRQGPVSEVAGD